MAFNIRHMHAVRQALAIMIKNMERYPWVTLIFSQLTYLPEAEQDIVAAIMRAEMHDRDADNIIAIFDRFTCPQCKNVGRACQCVGATHVSPPNAPVEQLPYEDMVG